MHRIKHNLNLVTRFELSAIIFITLVGIVFPQTLIYGTIIGLIFFVIRTVAKSQLTRRTPIDIAIFVFLVTILYTLFFSPNSQVTNPQVYRVIIGILVFYAIVNNILSIKNVYKLYWLLVFLNLLLAIYAILSIDWIIDKHLFIPKDIYKLLPSLNVERIHHNVLAGTLIFLFPLTLGVIIFSWKKVNSYQKILLCTNSIIVFIVLFLSQSRGALIALGVTLIQIISFRFKRGPIIIALISIVGLVMIYQLGFPIFFDIVSRGMSLSGWESREEIWARAILIIQSFPITGIGMGLFGELIDFIYPLFWAPIGSVPHAHNIFLQIAVDLGIPGLIAWFAILIIIFFSAWRIFMIGVSINDKFIMGLGIGLIGSQIALIVHGFFDAILWGMVRAAPFVWILWGLVIAGCNVIISMNLSNPDEM